MSLKHHPLYLVILFSLSYSHYRKIDQLPHPYVTKPEALSSPGDSCPDCYCDAGEGVIRVRKSE